jgi:polar amino acid transport system permease protein
MLKITSLLSVIGIEELFRVTQDIEASSFRVFETFLGCAVYYLALVSIWSIIQRLIERRFDFARVKSNRSLVTRILGKSGRGSGARQAQNPTNFGEGAIQRQLKEFEPDPVTKTTPEFSPRGGSNV